MASLAVEDDMQKSYHRTEFQTNVMPKDILQRLERNMQVKQQLSQIRLLEK